MEEQSKETRDWITQEIDRLEKVQRARVADRRYEEVVHSLFYPDISSRMEQVDHQFDGIESSYDWIFEGPSTRTLPWDDYARWLKTGHGVYWINGKAGSGKSTLMNHICTHDRRLEFLREWCSDRPLLTPAFFFWNSGSSLQKSIDGLLRSLLYQILEECRELIACFDNVPLHTWTTKRLRDTLLNILTQSQVPIAICMFIDGLDEYEGSSDIVIQLITDLANQTHVKVCVSSRPLLAFEKAFSGQPSLRLQDLTYDSIREFAEVKLSKPIKERFSLDQRGRYRAAELLESIVERADGVFLWATIAIRDLREGLRDSANMDELAQIIESLPSKLEDLFIHMLKNIKPAYQRCALQFLQIVLYSTFDTDGSSRFQFDLCTLHFSHSQWGSRDTPFVYEEIATSKLVAACRLLKTRLLSHTAGLLELRPIEFHWHYYNPIYATNREPDPILMTEIHFLHRTVRDFLLDNAEAKSLLACDGLTRAQVHLSIARGILAQLAHFSRGHDKIIETGWLNPVYHAIRASLQQISLAERILGAAQERLMRSLDFATFTQVRRVEDPCLGSGVIRAFMIENNSMDLVGMAAATGMTFYVCKQLELPTETRSYSPCLPDADSYSRNRCTAATICWDGGNQSQDPGSILASGIRSSKYRQALAKCLRWKTDNPSSLRMVAPTEVSTSVETYMLSCCTLDFKLLSCPSTFLELPRILLREGANPMVQVECLPQGVDNSTRPYTEVSSWHRWLDFLEFRHERYMDANEKSGRMLLEDRKGDMQITFNDVFNTTKAFLVHGADINYPLELSGFRNLKRRGLEGDCFRLFTTCSALFLLEQCFEREPEFLDFMVAMKPLVTTPTRQIDSIYRNDKSGNRDRPVGHFCPSIEESEKLWPLIEKWERTGNRDDRDSVLAAMEAAWIAHNPDIDFSQWGNKTEWELRSKRS